MFRRAMSVVLAIVLCIGCFSGCTSKKQPVSGNEKVTIKIGNWANKETQPEQYKRLEETKKRFEEKYPNIKVEGVTWYYDLATFFPSAASGQLPTMFQAPFTEVEKLVDSGYVSDVTKFMKKYGYTDNISPAIMELLSVDGKQYMIPLDVYVMGLYANKRLFEKAGLIDDDGNVIFPKTYEELATTATMIKEKTGAAGFVMPTTSNNGGWHFMNIAWSHGVEFMKKNDEGKWIATFDSPECVKALNYIRDLKFKYNVLPANIFVDGNEMRKLFATDQAAMYFATPPQKSLTDTYSMDKNDIAIGLMPEGPEGRYSLLGGSIMVLKDKLSDAEMDACFKWVEFTGRGSILDDTIKENLENDYKTKAGKGELIGVGQYPLWQEGVETRDYNDELIEKYANVDTANFKEFEEFDKLIVKPEEPVSCQQLYETLDSCIQAVLSDESADPESVLKRANNNFQNNYLNNAE